MRIATDWQINSSFAATPSPSGNARPRRSSGCRFSHRSNHAGPTDLMAPASMRPDAMESAKANAETRRPWLATATAVAAVANADSGAKSRAARSMRARSPLTQVGRWSIAPNDITRESSRPMLEYEKNNPYSPGIVRGTISARKATLLASDAARQTAPWTRADALGRLALVSTQCDVARDLRARSGNAAAFASAQKSHNAEGQPVSAGKQIAADLLAEQKE